MNTLLYPPSIDWELTSICNHNCIHCYNFWRGLNVEEHEVQKQDYFDSVAKKIIASNPVSVQITGGEPLVVWHEAKHAIQLLLDAGINVSVNTNATLVDDEIADFFAQNNMDVFVSFPCSNKEVFEKIVNCSGAAERAEKGIRILLNHNVRVSLNMVVSKINYPYVYETAMYVKQKFGVSYFSATKASFPQNANPSFRSQMLDNEEFNSMLSTLIKVKSETGMRVDSAWVYSICGFRDEKILKQFGFNRKCECGRYNFVLDARGNMKACGCDSHTYGNIMEKSFADAIIEMSNWQIGAFIPNECKLCQNLKVCGAGCRSDAYSSNGTKCSLDSTADINNIIEIHNDSYVSDNYSENMSFTLNKGVKAIEERCGVRLSFKTNYEFITKSFYAFLCENNAFSARQLKTISGCSEEEITRCINKLIKKQLLVETSGYKQERERGYGGFSLLYIPYLDECAPSFIKDYLCDNNIRYAR